MSLTVATPRPEVGDLIPLYCSAANLAARIERKARHGWHIADGRHGTDDLRDQFLKMGSAAGFTDIAAGAGAKNITPAGGVGVNNHVLSVEQMPAHNHGVGTNGYFQSGGLLEPRIPSSSDTYRSSNAGASWAHNHGASFSGTQHTNEPQHRVCVYLQYTGIRVKGVTP